MLLFVVYLLIVILAPVALSAVVGVRALPRGADCPNCAQPTLPLVSRLVKWLRRLRVTNAVQRRWCPACDWDGYAITAAGPPLAGLPSGRRQRQQLRTLELGGRAWRVMLESWCEGSRFVGRLLFVGPSGKLWSDPQAVFCAASHEEVLRQAKSLSDRLLAYRLREAISG